MKKFCSSTYKAFESIFTNPFLQVFFAKMKYSLTNSKFQEAFGRYFRRKIIFLLITCGNEDYVSCFWKKVKKEAPTFIVNACHMSLLILKNSCGKSTGVPKKCSSAVSWAICPGCSMQPIKRLPRSPVRWAYRRRHSYNGAFSTMLIPIGKDCI